MSNSNKDSLKTIRKPFEPASTLRHVRFVMYEIASLAREAGNEKIAELAGSVNNVLNGTPNSVNSLAMQCLPVKWWVGGQIFITRTTAPDQPEAYAVVADNWELNHSGDWELPRMDSIRNSEWLSVHRWPTFEAALEAAFVSQGKQG